MRSTMSHLFDAYWDRGAVLYGEGKPKEAIAEWREANSIGGRKTLLGAGRLFSGLLTILIRTLQSNSRFSAFP